MQRLWFCFFFSAVILLLLYAPVLTSSVFACVLRRTSRLQEREICRTLPVLQHRHSTTCFCCSPRLRSSRRSPAWRCMPPTRQRRGRPTTAATTAASMLIVHAPAFCWAEMPVEREVTAGMLTITAALQAGEARDSLAPRSPAHVLQPALAAAAAHPAAIYAAGLVHSPSSASCATHGGGGVRPFLELWRAAARGERQYTCAYSMLSAAASAEEAAVGGDNTAANAVPADMALGAAARGDPGRTAELAATAKRKSRGDPSSSILARCATGLPSAKQKPTLVQLRDRGVAAASRDKRKEEEGQPRVVKDDFNSAVTANGAEKQQELHCTCIVPVGSVAAFQEYARRLSIWKKADMDVFSNSGTSNSAVELQEKKEGDAQQQEEVYGRQKTRGQHPQQHQRTAEEGEEQQKRTVPQQKREKNKIEVDRHSHDWTQQPDKEQQQCQKKEYSRKRRVVVLGSTGSIGRSTMQVVEAFPDRFEVVGLAATGTNLPLLLFQIQRHRPRYVAVGTAATAAALKKLLLSPAAVHLPDTDGAPPASSPATPDVRTAARSAAAIAAASPPFAAVSPSTADAAARVSPTSYHSFDTADASAAEPPSIASERLLPQILYGSEGLVELAALDDYDVLVSAIVGFAGLQPTLKALTTGKDVALANKETLVAAGDIFRGLYKTSSGLSAHGRRSQRPYERSRQAPTYSIATSSEKVCSGGSPVAAPEASGTYKGTSFSPLYPSSSIAAVEQQQQQKPLGLLLPVDSEHSAIFQALQGVAPINYPPRKLLLVATGGPFRGCKRADLQHVALDQVLKHPRWSMGAKISVDSATLMNKGLEVIEAHYAFGCPYSTIQVLVHPQAVVHSAVELCDGAILAQLGAADMKLPLAYALTWPERLSTSWPRVDLLKEGILTFEKPDYDTFGCLRLAYEAGIQGGLAPACLNAANEVAVKRLLDGKLSFLQIEELVRHVLREYDRHDGNRPADAHTLQDVLEADSWARRIAEKWKK